MYIVIIHYMNMLVDYTSGEVPVGVHMEAFNPCIPLDSKNSGLPVIIFTFTVTNTSSSAANVCFKACTLTCTVPMLARR